VLDANKGKDRPNLGGRPVAEPANWLSGVLDCPGCGGRLHVHGGHTPAGNPRTPKLRCGGHYKKRLACGQFKGIEAQPVTDAIAALFAGDDSTDILAFQRIAGNAHELDALRASLAKLQAKLSFTEDDAELDALVAERKMIRAAIDSFTVVPDSYDYAPTGQTVAGMWAGDEAAKRNMVKAVKATWGLELAEHDGQWEIVVGAASGETGEAGEIVDLGNGLCFRRQAA
jgi:hypothetical protein